MSVMTLNGGVREPREMRGRVCAGAWRERRVKPGAGGGLGCARSEERTDRMSINWKLRAKSPAFWVGVAGAAVTPVLAYLGLGLEDMTSWGALLDVGAKFVSNPYLIGLCVSSVAAALGVVVDPTTPGVSDSERALARGRE